MMQFITRSTIATGIAYLVLSTSQERGFSAVLAAFVACFVTALLWDVVGRAAKWVRRDDRKKEMISQGQCPGCLKLRSLEVTSDAMCRDPGGRTYREVVLACINCDDTYILEATPPKDQAND